MIDHDMLIPIYRPRYIGRLASWEFSNWTFKVYGISAAAQNHKLDLDPSLIAAARGFVEANLPHMNETPHYGVGFVILHHGSGAKSLLTQWWTNECVCLQTVAQSNFLGLPEFRPARQDLMACVYELVAIDFERRAWITTVMSGRSMSDYHAASLEDGFY
ncbi:hypothetical protein E2F50_05205 [Rhizobium deserti]|uniref:Uncharacterized protein n=1 Tax=Rhizobium deserti TaxID=2547961 RepID=A0A4R5UNL2_9HYPH|nr:hypothetical protein [Rhizobium deserti]TDK39512.1 hypothetical protein E2F50_05205 [Rhizobium deserti]